MANYKFDWINANTTIINPSVSWEGAGFTRGVNAQVTLDIRLTNSGFDGVVTLSVMKEANDRSDEAIDALMLLLLEPYEV
jgi:hypothetical protein